MDSREERLQRLRGALGSSESESKKKLERLKEYQSQSAMNRLDSATDKLVSRAFVEDKLGGTLKTGKELSGLMLHRGVSTRDDLERKIKYAQNYLDERPEKYGKGTKVYGVIDDYGRPVIAYREQGSKDFYYLNDPGPSSGDWGSVIGAIVSAETIGGAAVELVNPIKKGKAVTRLGKFAYNTYRGAKSGLGAGAGRLIDEIGEDISDKEAIDALQTIEEAGWSTLMGYGSHQIGSGVQALANFRRGVQGEHVVSGEDVQAVADIAAKRDFQPLGAGEYGIPVAERAQAQAKAMTEEAAAREARKAEGPAEALTRREGMIRDLSGREAPVDELSDKMLLDLMERDERNLKNWLSRRVSGFKRKTKEEGGQAVIDTVNNYASVTRETANRLYDDVFDIAKQYDVQFDISSFVAKAKEELAPLALAGKELDGAVDQALMSEVPIPRAVEESAYLTRLLNQIVKANDIQGPERLEALRKLSTDLRNLADPGTTLTPTPAQRTAAQLNNELTNAINRSGPKEYVDAVAKANKHWAQRQKNLGTFNYIAKATETMGGGEIVFRRAMGGQMTSQEAIFLAKTMSDEAKRGFTNAVYTSMIDNPRAAYNQLGSLGEAGAILIPKQIREEARAMQIYAQRLDSGAADRLIRQYEEGAQRVRAMVQNGDSDAMKKMIQNGAMSKPAISQAVVHNFIKDTTQFVNNKLRISPKQFENAYEKYAESGMLDLLDKQTRELLSDIRTYSSFLDVGANSGDSIAAAAQASQIFKGITHPREAVGAAIAMYQTNVAARLAHHPKVIAALRAQALEPRQLTKTRATMTGTMLILRQMLESQSVMMEDQSDKEMVQ